MRPSFIKSLNTEDKMTVKDWLIEILWYNPVSIFLRKQGRFILRLIRWIPVLYKQEEWDFGYIYPILELKIKELRKAISEDTWHTEDCIKEELEQIDEVLSCLDKYINWTDYIEIPETPKNHDEFPKTEDGLYAWNPTKEQHKAYQKANKFEEENFNKFWNKLKEYHRNWWT